MHAVVVRVTINDFDESVKMLKEQIVPGASQAPGFVTGYWTRSDDDRGLSMIVFESEEAANGAAQMIQTAAESNDTVTLDGIEVREVVANA
jgi:heme-degrading monooxygenase HmoA